MNKMRFTSILASVFAFALVSSSIRAQGKEAAVLRLSRTIALPGVTGGFDHLAYDQQRKQLFLAAEDQGTVEVVDLMRGKRTRNISGFKNPHSILFRTGASTFLVTDSGADASALIDTTTLRKTRTLKLALGANCILFDPERKAVYVTAGGDRVGEKASTLEVVNPDTGAVLKSVQVDALHLQPMALDSQTGRLFVNLADQNAIGIYNPQTLDRIATWHISKGRGNSPIAFDSEHRRLFVIASEPGTLLELDADSGELKSSTSTPPDPDDMALDLSSQRIFVPGEGALSAYDVSVPGSIKLLQKVTTGKNARTGILFDSARKYAVAVPAEGDKAARVLIFEIQR
jgi:DNA-binding beta-propeller fold protein YncE